LYLEQNRFYEDDIFSLRLDAQVTVNKWEVTEEYDFFDAEHSGYRRLKNPVTHRRQIYFDKTEGFWIIKDILDGRGEHQFDLYFHFAPLEIEFDKEFPLVVRTKTKGANLAIIPLETDEVSREIEEGWVSYVYGIKSDAPVLRYSMSTSTPTSFCNVICPYTESISTTELIKKAQALVDSRLQDY
jgi:hypothetical protein